MTNPDFPHDPRFPAAQPPQAPQAPQQPVHGQPPQAPQAPQQPVYGQPPQAPQAPQQQPPQAPQAPQAPQQQQPPFAQQPPPSYPGAAPGWTDPNQPQFFESNQPGGHTVEETATSGSSVLGRVGLVAAALAVAGGGAFAVTRALSEPAGPQSPDEAVTQLFDAIDNDDLLGLTEVMLPSEREALIEPMTDFVAELQRLEIIDAEFDVETADTSQDGLDFSVTGLGYTTNTVGEGVVNVSLTGGEVRVSGNVDDLPFGAQVDEALENEDLDDTFSESIVDFAEESDARFTVVEEDGSWYVSLWYSVAEAARAESDEPAPDFGNGLTPVGGATPEDALRNMIEAGADLDIETVLATLDPNEFRALHDYAPLFLDDVDEAIAELRDQLDQEGISWQIDRLDMSSSEVRGRTVATVEGFAFSGVLGSQDETFSFDFDGECATAIQGRTIEEFCLSEFRDEFADSDLPAAYLDLFDQQSTGLTVVERDGQWYVSGFPSIIGVYTDLLASLEPEDIDELTSFFQDSLQGAFELSDPFLGTDPFEPVDPFEPIEPFEEVPFDDEPFDDMFTQPELTPEDLALFPEGWTVSTWDPVTAYFGGSIGLQTLTYLEGWDDQTFGPTIYIERFDATADEINAGMSQSFAYEQVEVEGLPAGATAWDWEGVDRAVVIDGFIIAAYFDEDGTAMALLTERVNDIANR